MRNRDDYPAFKPYTIEPIRTTFFGRTEFAVQFEGSTIRTTTLTYQEAKDIAFLLNVAYSTGYATGDMHREIYSQD